MNTLSKRACLLAGGLTALLAVCVSVLWLRQRGAQNAATYTAYIYQNGRLLHSISLDQVTETYRFTVDAAGGGYNIVEVSPTGISIAEADCPDQICVLQGRVSDSLLPITCLPHRLVIELNPQVPAPTGSSPDAIVY